MLALTWGRNETSLILSYQGACFIVVDAGGGTVVSLSLSHVTRRNTTCR